jgi:hypothetical protein
MLYIMWRNPSMLDGQHMWTAGNGCVNGTFCSMALRNGAPLERETDLSLQVDKLSSSLMPRVYSLLFQTELCLCADRNLIKTCAHMIT